MLILKYKTPTAHILFFLGLIASYTLYRELYEQLSYCILLPNRTQKGSISGEKRSH